MMTATEVANRLYAVSGKARMEFFQRHGRARIADKEKMIQAIIDGDDTISFQCNSMVARIKLGILSGLSDEHVYVRGFEIDLDSYTFRISVRNTNVMDCEWDSTYYDLSDETRVKFALLFS